MKYAWVIVLLAVFWASAASASEAVADSRQSPSAAVTDAPSKFTSSEDGWLDVSGFLDETYGFVPLVVPITEPAVGYGAAGGLIFVDKTKENAQAGVWTAEHHGRGRSGNGERHLGRDSPETPATGWTTGCRHWRERSTPR